MLLVSLTSPRVTPDSFQLVLRVLDSVSSNLRPPWLLPSLNGQFSCVTPGWASVLINVWVSLWDHCMVWGVGLNHSHKFLSHPRKPKWPGGVLSLFFRAKLSYIFLTFILTNSIKAVKLRESVRSASYLTTQPRPYSPLQWSDLRIFQPRPGYSLIFSNQGAPTQYLSTGWAILLASFSRPPTQYLLTGIFWLEFLSIFLPSPTHCLDHKWVVLGCFTQVVPPSPPVCSC